MRNLIILDVKTTCFADKMSPTHFFPEVIRLQAIIMDSQTLRVLDEYQCHIRPTQFPNLSDFCIRFTHVTQDQVDQGITFTDAITQIQEFVSPYEIIPSFWGYYGQLQLLRNCRRFNIHYPFPKRFITIKHNYSKFYGLNKIKKLKNVLAYHGLDLSTQKEDPLADVRRVAQIVAILIEEGWEHRYLKN